MTTQPRATFRKEERIYRKKLIDKLFGEGSQSMTAFPIRALFRFEEAEPGDDSPMVRILISAPKRCFKLAVKRNRVKRQIREAYRLNKQPLTESVAAMGNKRLLVAFIWTDRKLHSSREVAAKTKKLLQRLSEAKPRTAAGSKAQ